MKKNLKQNEKAKKTAEAVDFSKIPFTNDFMFRLYVTTEGSG